MENKKHLEELALFIREHRSNEQNFEILYEKLLAEQVSGELNANPEQGNYQDNLTQTLEKHAAAYKENKNKGISSWAEFENFVSHFEKSVIDALNGN